MKHFNSIQNTLFPLVETMASIKYLLLLSKGVFYKRAASTAKVRFLAKGLFMNENSIVSLSLSSSSETNHILNPIGIVIFRALWYWDGRRGMRPQILKPLLNLHF